MQDSGVPSQENHAGFNVRSLPRRSPAGTWPLAAAAILAGAAMGCRDAEVSAYNVPKGVEPTPPSPTVADPAPATPQTPPTTGASSTPDLAAAGPDLLATVTLPAGWERVPGERPMRVATYTAPDPQGPAEVAVTQFPGRVGGELANINRWRGQMGLPPVDEADLESTIQRFAADGFDGYLTRVRGSAQHMLAAGVYQASADRTWFIRATVSPDTADRLEPVLFGFARAMAGLDAPGGN